MHFNTCKFCGTPIYITASIYCRRNNFYWLERPQTRTEHYSRAIFDRRSLHRHYPSDFDTDQAFEHPKITPTTELGVVITTVPSVPSKQGYQRAESSENFAFSYLFFLHIQATKIIISSSFHPSNAYQTTSPHYLRHHLRRGKRIGHGRYTETDFCHGQVPQESTWRRSS